MGKRFMKFNVSLEAPQGLAPALHVSLAWVERVADEVQVYLCDVDMMQLRQEIETQKEAKEPGEALEIQLHAKPFQKVFLSRLAAQSMFETLARVLSSWKEENESTEEESAAP